MIEPFFIEVITLFPRMIEAPLAESILGKAQQRGLLRIATRDLRPYGEGKHRLTDDTPYGGGAGMVMKPEPLVRAIEDSRSLVRGPVILLDPQGKAFKQAEAMRLSALPGMILVCGRYEGVDERIRSYVDETFSVGDFVLTGGEPAALCLIDAVARLRAGVLGNETSTAEESFAHGLLEGPQYTRPVEFRGERVPEVLLSGHHGEVRRWRHREALARTLAVRPEILDSLALSQEDKQILEDLRAAQKQGIAPARTAPDSELSGAEHQ